MPTSTSEISVASEADHLLRQRQQPDDERAGERQDDQDASVRASFGSSRIGDEDDGEDGDAAREREDVGADEAVLDAVETSPEPSGSPG